MRKGLVAALSVLIFSGLLLFYTKPCFAGCAGSGSSSYTSWECKYYISVGYYCATNGTDTNSGSCSYHNSVCSFTETVEEHCTADGSSCSISNQCGLGKECYNPAGCTICDETSCKSGTTTYTQSCGSTTRDYSCTDQCDGTLTWKTYNNACKECQTATNCGSNPRDCSADYCQHCEPTLGAWSSCGSDHKQSRSCTENDGYCDGDDCATKELERDCVGTITGTLFDASDVGNTCTAAEISASPKIGNQAFSILPTPNASKWPIISGSAPTVTTNASGVYSQQVYASQSLPANYIFDYTALLNSSRVAGIKTQCGVSMATVIGNSSNDQVVTKNTGFWRVYGGWWQVVGGSVYAAEGIESTIPASVLPMTDQVLILPNANGRDGLLSYGVAWQGTELGTNPNVQVSNSLRRIRSLYAGLRYDYNFYKTRMDVFTKTAWDGGAVTYNDGGKGYQIFTHTGDVTLNALSLSGSQKAIFLVDGDVTISGNILSPVGTFMGIISSGKITVRPWVTDVQGWVVAETIDIPCEDANSNGVCDKTDVQFKGEGSFVAWTDTNFDRDQYKVNNTQPSEKFVYRNDFLLNVPAPMKVYTRKFTPFVP